MESWIMQHALEVLGILIIVIGSVWGLIKYLQAQIESQRTEFESKIDVLHSRILDVRKEYVHQDHMDDLLGAIRDSVGNVADEQRRTNSRIDTLLNHLLEAKK